MDKQGYKLSKDEKRRIKEACRSWSGRSLPKAIKDVCRDYNIEYKIDTRGHYLFVLGNKKIRAPWSPSDWRNGRAFGQKLINLIKEE